MERKPGTYYDRNREKILKQLEQDRRAKGMQIGQGRRPTQLTPEEVKLRRNKRQAAWNRANPDKVMAIRSRNLQKHDLRLKAKGIQTIQSPDLPMLGKRIARLRKERNLVQYDLAVLMGISQSSIGMIETNKRDPNSWLIVRLCMALQVSADYLLGLSGNIDGSKEKMPGKGANEHEPK